MKLDSFVPRLLVCLLLLFPCGVAFAGTVSVDCSGPPAGAYSSLQAAIDSSPDQTSFSVAGTCNEEITIFNRRLLQISGVNGNSTITHPLIIFTSDNISFFQMTFNGHGIGVTSSTNVSFTNVNIQNAPTGMETVDSEVGFFAGSISNGSTSGIIASGGSLHLDGVTIANNGRFGVVTQHAHLTAGESTFTDNASGGMLLLNATEADIFDGVVPTTITGGKFGISATNGSTLIMGGGLINSNNGPGVFCAGNTHCEFTGTHIDGNSGPGLQVLQHSDLALDGTVEISGNSGPGIELDLLSSLTSAGGNTIANNKGDGITLNTLSAVNLTASDTITALPGTFALNCNNGSMVEGDISKLKTRKCGGNSQDNSTN